MYLTRTGLSDCPLEAQSGGTTRSKATGHQLFRRIEAGRHLFFQGDDATSLYEVKSGMVRMARVLENGRRHIITFGMPGEFVGFPTDGIHNSDCDAITDAVVLVHPRAALENEKPDPALHKRLTRAALREICAMQSHLMLLSSNCASEKLAAFLLTVAQRGGYKTDRGIAIELPMYRVDIADFLGLTTETVCRTFTKFRNENLVCLDTPQHVVLLDLPTLQAIGAPN